MLVVAQEGKGRHAFIIRIFSSPDLMLAPLFKCEGEKKGSQINVDKIILAQREKTTSTQTQIQPLHQEVVNFL